MRLKTVLSIVESHHKGVVTPTETVRRCHEHIRTNPRLARPLLALLNADDDLLVGDNAPYVVDDATDYTIPVHGEQRGLPHVLLEIRQDLIEDESGQREWAVRLARLLPKAYECLR